MYNHQVGSKILWKLKNTETKFHFSFLIVLAHFSTDFDEIRCVGKLFVSTFWFWNIWSICITSNNVRCWWILPAKSVSLHKIMCSWRSWPRCLVFFWTPHHGILAWQLERTHDSKHYQNSACLIATQQRMIANRSSYKNGKFFSVFFKFRHELGGCTLYSW